MNFAVQKKRSKNNGKNGVLNAVPASPPQTCMQRERGMHVL